ncbi:hypothetical protein MNBD_IGNAVI01-1604 [hydrothermal vent metagenome]|uniref:Phosphatidylglycerol lysyltransferase C-terminal domain-containing protein n=2 Tax=hydrothermal vent metagenome TaxID=652676 RepID=A0A3B1CPW0_9ZZZZ
MLITNSKFDQLPLSWIYSVNKKESNYVKLGHSTYWLYSCTIPNFSCITEILNRLSDTPNTNFIIRGCSKEISDHLANHGFSSILTGKEATIDLDKDPFKKGSLRELVRRGLKKGRIEEMEFSEGSVKKLEELRLHWAHSNEPQLKYLFVDKFIPGTRLFAFIDKAGIWQGAILTSPNSPTKIQTELLLRRKSASIGTMEALVNFIFQKFREEGFLEWSLGEVPFVVEMNNFPFLSKGYLLNKTGRMLKYAYNYEGLYFFKNKFAPRWNDIYLCAKPKVKFKHVILLSHKSKLAALTIQKLIN